MKLKAGLSAILAFPSIVSCLEGQLSNKFATDVIRRANTVPDLSDFKCSPSGNNVICDGCIANPGNSSQEACVTVTCPSKSDLEYEDCSCAVLLKDNDQGISEQCDTCRYCESGAEIDCTNVVGGFKQGDCSGSPSIGKDTIGAAFLTLSGIIIAILHWGSI